MLASISAAGPFVDQASGLMIGFVGLGTVVGSFFAGRISFRKSMLDNLKAEAKSWEGLYKVTKEQVEANDARIADLIKEGHEKDKQIAALSAKIDVITQFMTKAMGKNFSVDTDVKL